MGSVTGSAYLVHRNRVNYLVKHGLASRYLPFKTLKQAGKQIKEMEDELK